MRREIYLFLFVIVASFMFIATPAIAIQSIDFEESTSISPKVLDNISQESGAPVEVLIQTYTRDYRSLTSQISALGGTVTQEFKYTTGIAATVPSNFIMGLKEHLNVKKISLDEKRTINAVDKSITPLDLTELNSQGIEIDSLTVEQIQTSLSNPETYYNYESMGAVDVWSTGNFGQGSLVVVIDTGIYAGHVMFGHGPIIGGVDLSADVGTPYEGFDLPTNHWHGTHVSGIIAGAAALGLPATHPLYLAWSKYTGYNTGGLIELYGMAPLAQLYGIKVFDHTGGGVPESAIIASIEYAIDLHVSGTYDVDVISMSLGGGTGFDGRDLEDQIVDYATSVGITVVTSTGNSGPASMTGGSPGTANSAISVGAVSHPVNTKIYMEYRYGVGDYVFPTNDLQIAAFSSRGPTADGRDHPTVVSTGVNVLSAYTSSPGGLAWAGGTSMACPAVSGAVALLNNWGEVYGASPYDYKEAIRDGASWIDGYDIYDQGAGFLNAKDALDALMNDDSLGDSHPPIKKWYKPIPVEPKGIQVRTKGKKAFTYSVENLSPGHAVDFFLKTSAKTSYIKIELLDVETGIDPIGWNGFELFVQSPVRSTEDYYIDAWVYDDAVFEIREFETTYTEAVYIYEVQSMQFQPGYMRIVLQNEWDSYDWMSGTIKITVEEKKCFNRPFSFPDDIYAGFLKTGGEKTFSVDFETLEVRFELFWFRDWSWYPTSDLDLIIEWFDGTAWYTDNSGATYRSPEIVNLNLNGMSVQEIRVTISASETYDRIEPWILFIYYL